MCDTIVALNSSEYGGGVLFGKNSDREPDEVQNIRIIPRLRYPDGTKVACTYITIPQVNETERVFLCQPFWMFGAEMGANEHGVIIGNEAIFTREKPALTGLTGMDLVRLGLERSKSAREALEVIIDLLEEYGQGGNCGYRYKLHYMNSFIIADERESYVLETVKKWWAWKKIKNYWSISNIISLEQDFDDCSEGLIANAIKKGYCKDEKDFNFRRCYSDKFMTLAAGGITRERRSRELIKHKYEKYGKCNTQDLINILRDHGDEENYNEKQESTSWRPDKSKNTLCLHARDPLIRRTQTVCSLAAKVGSKGHFYYTTGTSNPCLSPFFPLFLNDTSIPQGYQEGGADYNENSYWWESEKYHRQALQSFTDVISDIRPSIEKYEENMFSKIEDDQLEITQGLIDGYFEEARDLVRQSSRKLENLGSKKLSWLYRNYWLKYNNLNKIK